MDGQCFCKPTYSGLKCDRCLPGFYGFPVCKQCNCNPAGTKPGPGGQPGDCSTNNNVSQEGCPSWGEGRGDNMYQVLFDLFSFVGVTSKNL